MESLSKKLRKFILVTVMISFSLFIANVSFTFSQLTYIGFGYNGSYGVGFKNLNYVISRYNETRSYLTKQMDEIHGMKGLAFNSGLVLNNVLIGLDWAGRSHITYAQADDGNGGTTQRDLKFSMNNLSFTFGLCPNSDVKVIPAFGFTVDLGSIKVRTRVAGKNAIENEPFSIIRKDVLGGTTLFIQYLIAGGKEKGLGILFRPYFQFPWVGMDFWDTDEALNPNTFFDDPVDLNSSCSNFGINLTLVYFNKHY